ncbi:MAG: hypothetical protein EOP83_12295 [Verrucomicrobiaceae bacterium]|nr:MAG: hypothetical protein EOP83_12295 [Verrucomicrobiaceae bacterium]
MAQQIDVPEFPPSGWDVILVRPDLEAASEAWLKEKDRPGTYAVEIKRDWRKFIWLVYVAISNPDVAFEFKMKFG